MITIHYRNLRKVINLIKLRLIDKVIEKTEKNYMIIYTDIKLEYIFEEFEVQIGETYAPRYSRQVNCVS